MKTVGCKKAHAPLAQLREITGIDAEALEGAPARGCGSSGHGGMDRAHVNVDRVEQQRGAVWVCIEPTLKRDLLEMLCFTGARFDLRLVHVFDIRLLPVMRFGADGGNVQSMC